MQVVHLRSQPSLASISQLTRKVFLHFRATQQAGYLCSEVKVAIVPISRRGETEAQGGAPR